MKELTIKISDESLEKIKLIKGGSFMLVHQPDTEIFTYKLPQVLEKNMQLVRFGEIITVISQ